MIFEGDSRISEKWFYTHIKPTQNEKLPRVDMLDLLTQFLDYSDWENFKTEQEKLIQPTTENFEQSTVPKNIFSKQTIGFLTLGFVGLIMLFSFFFKKNNAKNFEYQFCFIDADTGKAIQNPEIEINILRKKESATFQKVDENGCFIWTGKSEQIQFEILAPYFYKDTVSRILDKSNTHEIIPLQRDDYGLMIHLFSNSTIEDWEKRRNQLAEMITDDAMIFHVDANDDTMGLEILNKEDFINRMTLPINSLRNVKVIETIYKNEKIHRLRFIITK